MFSDKLRLFKIILPLLSIVPLIIYGQIQIPQNYPGYKEAKAEPDKFDGKEIYFGGKILDVEDGHFLVENEQYKVLVEGKIDKSVIGGNISGKAVFRRNKTLTMQDYHISNLRKYKVIVSLFPFIFVLFLFWKQYSFDFKEVMFKKRVQDI